MKIVSNYVEWICYLFNTKDLYSFSGGYVKTLLSGTIFITLHADSINSVFLELCFFCVPQVIYILKICDAIFYFLIGWVENRLYGREWPENEMYHTYQSDRQKLPPPTKPKPRKPKVCISLDSVWLERENE